MFPLWKLSEEGPFGRVTVVANHMSASVSVWLYIISKVKRAVSHPGLQTEFVIQNLTS